MPAEIYAGLSAFKSMLDMAKALKGMNDAAIRNRAVIKLQEKILAAREAQSLLLERVSELEKQVADFEQWETEKRDYEMRRLASGSIVYILKADISAAKPSHYLCANCYAQRKASILQPTPRSVAHVSLQKSPTYKCPECRAEVVA